MGRSARQYRPGDIFVTNVTCPNWMSSRWWKIHSLMSTACLKVNRSRCCVKLNEKPQKSRWDYYPPQRPLQPWFLDHCWFFCGHHFLGGFNTALEVTNTEAFCISCHEMVNNVFEELKTTIHYSNRSGGRATCPDCHVPHAWIDKIARKMRASKEVYGKIFGTISTRAKFQAERRELAEHEWERFEANDSLECRNCHNYDSMDSTLQSTRAMKALRKFLKSGEKTCIDCPKGIARELPDMTGVSGFH
jgi:cytochrome c-type protein NapC